MSRETVLARARAFALTGMVDTCTITRVASEPTNTISGLITPTYTTVYSGPCEIQQAQALPRPQEAGEARRLMIERVLKLPVATSTGVLADDLVTITACLNDADLVGKVFHVRGEFGKSHATARRLLIEGATS